MPTGGGGQPARYPRAAGMGDAADQPWERPHSGTFLGWTSAPLSSRRPGPSATSFRGADPTTPVPTCPGWTLNQVFKHVGRGNRWCAQIIAERRDQPLDPRDVRDGKPPEDPEAAIAWLNDSAQLVIDAIDRVGSDARVWTFVGSKPAGWWVRRRVHEQVIHRADVALALGAELRSCPPSLAADGVGERLEMSIVQADRHYRRRAWDDPASSCHRRGLGPTGEWTVVHDEDGLNWSHDHTKGEAAVRGRAVDLLLVLTRRRTAAEAGVDVFGDAEVWETWLARTPL